MPRILPILLVLAATVLAAPAAALADGTVTLTGGQLRYENKALTTSDLFVTRSIGPVQCGTQVSPCIQIADGQETTDGVAGTACVQVSAVVACDPAALTTIFLNLKDGDDRVFIGSGVKPVSVDGGDGDDTISLGSGDDLVQGGAGNDVVEMDDGDDTLRLDDVANDGRQGEGKNIRSDVETVDGGGGGDTMFGNAGPNTLLGGPGNDLIDAAGGNDVLEGGPGADDLIGGAGQDRVAYTDAAAQRISLDGVRDDGAPGELDNVRTDIEDIAAGAGNDELLG